MQLLDSNCTLIAGQPIRFNAFNFKMKSMADAARKMPSQFLLS
jgi:hypothetical protein